MGSQGKAMSPSEEPTTTKAKLVVIVGYIKGKPFISLHACHEVLTFLALNEFPTEIRQISHIV